MLQNDARFNNETISFRWSIYRPYHVDFASLSGLVALAGNRSATYVIPAQRKGPKVLMKLEGEVNAGTPVAANAERVSYDDATLVPDQREQLRPMLGEKQILDRLPIARSTLQNWEKEGHFPKSVQIGPNRKAWYADEVAAWQKQRESVR
jgi:predicted DNA-binding transcriptional regulator AlpA